MATLYISYFGGADKHCAYDPIASETVTTSGTSAQSTANTKFGTVAKIQSDAAHYIKDGSNPTATAAAGVYVAANEVFWLRLNPGYKIAAITA